MVLVDEWYTSFMLTFCEERNAFIYDTKTLAISVKFVREKCSNKCHYLVQSYR